MYYIVDMETRRVMAHKDGSRMVYAALDLAHNHALMCQEMTGHPFQVIGVMMPVTNTLDRSPAPWLC